MDKHLIELSIKAVLIIVASIFIFILIVKRFLYFRPSLHFLPTRENYQEINNGHLNGWLLPGPNRAHGEKSKIILLCHGNGGNISHKEEKMISMRIMGYSVFVFDYYLFNLMFYKIIHQLLYIYNNPCNLNLFILIY